jgi:hypothetical protein
VDTGNLEGNLMSLSNAQQDAIKSTLKDVLISTRPSEVFLVDESFKPQVSVARRIDATAFGGGAEIVLLVYPVLEVLKELATTAATGFAKKWGEGLAHFLLPAEKAATPIMLNPTALQLLRSAVIARLTKEGVTPTDCEMVGDSVVSVLIAKPRLLRQMVTK